MSPPFVVLLYGYSEQGLGKKHDRKQNTRRWNLFLLIQRTPSDMSHISKDQRLGTWKDIQLTKIGMEWWSNLHISDTFNHAKQNKKAKGIGTNKKSRSKNISL